MSIDIVIRELEESIDRGSCQYWLLSGGKSPRYFFERLSVAKDYSKVKIFFTDERLVPNTSDMSNYGNFKRYFIDRFSADNVAPSVYPITTENCDSYYSDIMSHLGSGLFDFVLLGTNSDDLHVASIFDDKQGSMQYSKVKRMDEDFDRYSIGYSLLNRSLRTVLLVNEEKLKALESIKGPVNNVRIDKIVLVDV